MNVLLILTETQRLWQLTPAMPLSAAFRAWLNNRWQSHYWSFVESFFMFSLRAATYLWDCYRTHYGIFYRLRYPLS